MRSRELVTTRSGPEGKRRTIRVDAQTTLSQSAPEKGGLRETLVRSLDKNREGWDYDKLNEKENGRRSKSWKKKLFKKKASKINISVTSKVFERRGREYSGNEKKFPPIRGKGKSGHRSASGLQVGEDERQEAEIIKADGEKT